MLSSESSAELLHDINILPFVPYQQLPTGALNAVRNFLANEMLSVRHQLHLLSQHYHSLDNSYQEAVRVSLARTKLSDETSPDTSDPLAAVTAASVASTSGTQ